MPLVIPRYSLAEIVNFASLFVKDDAAEIDLNEATALLINYMPVIGVSKITDSNADDAWLRIAAHQAQFGTPIDGTAGQPWYLTRADVIRHIGLITEAADEPIEHFWRYLIRRQPCSEADSPFMRANSGHSLLSLFQVSEIDLPPAEH